MSIHKYGKMIFNKEVNFIVDFNSTNDIEFTLKVNDASIDETIKNKLLSFIWACALAENYVQKRLIKFIAFDTPFCNNNYENGIYNAIHELHRKGIQTIITSNEQYIQNIQNIEEIKNEYMTGYLNEDDKLMGEF